MKNLNGFLGALVLGLFVGGFSVIAVLEISPQDTKPYIRGMIDCKLLPDKCNRQFEIYSLEQKAHQLRRAKAND